jgi:hypothetical protein
MRIKSTRLHPRNWKWACTEKQQNESHVVSNMVYCRLDKLTWDHLCVWPQSSRKPKRQFGFGDGLSSFDSGAQSCASQVSSLKQTASYVVSQICMKSCVYSVIIHTHIYMKKKWNFHTESLELKRVKSAGGYEYFGRLHCLVTINKKQWYLVGGYHCSGDICCLKRHCCLVGGYQYFGDMCSLIRN